MRFKIYFPVIIALLISSISFSQTSVKKVISSIAIDGNLDESFWDISLQLTPNASSDNIAKFGVLWDNNYLYVGVNVTDNILCNNNGQSIYDDGIEIYIDGNNSKTTTFDQYDRLFVKPVNSFWIQEMEKRYDGVIHKYMKTINGYSMEFAIPWGNFGITPTPDKSIGFNVIVNDDDDPNRYTNNLGSLLWVVNPNYYKNSSTWGTIILSSEEVSSTGKSIYLINPNGGDFLINNKIKTINWVSSGISNINIEYSTNNGSEWLTIDNNISASNNYYEWNVTSTPSDNCLIKISESGNIAINDISENVFTISSSLTAVKPLIPNTWKNYQWPYNAYFPEHEDGINGHIGSACGHASLARILHFWEYPITGNDNLSFPDNGGNYWSADFENTTYNYDNMPPYLASNSTENEYKDVATLTYHAATSMHDIGGSGGDLYKMSYAMSHYFKYKVSIPKFRKNYTKAQWTKLLMNELDNGRPLLIVGITSDVVGEWHESRWCAGHWFHIDGYNEEGKFHGVLGFSDEDGYFDIENVFNYTIYTGILVGLEPNLNGKNIALQSLNNGESLPQNQSVEIKWNSTNIDNIRIEFTVDNGKNWEVIHDSFVASLGKITWTTPNISTEECKVKITDITDINVYDKSDLELSIKPYNLELTSLKGVDYLISNELTNITWANTPVENIKIEFTDNNGSSWQEIVSSISTISGSYNWTVPNIKSKLCKIKITDVTNASIFDESSNTFEIGIANNAGGPYTTDEHTVLLLHFNDNLLNQSTLTNDGVFHGDNISYSNSVITQLGKSLKLNNKSYVSIPHDIDLDLTEDWTIEMWVYFNSIDGDYLNPTLVSKSDGSYSNYFLWYHKNWKSMKGMYQYSGGDVYSATAYEKISTGKWYHVKYTRDNTNYINKIIVRDSNLEIIDEKEYNYGKAKSVPLTNTGDLLIGNLFGTHNFYINGFIDELRISNIVRTFEPNLAVTETGENSNYSIYPNPASSNIYIYVPYKTNMTISTITGKVVLEKVDFKGGIINTSKLNKGVYIITFKSSEGVFNKKLIIE